jgi:hypothetical protein
MTSQTRSKFPKLVMMDASVLVRALEHTRSREEAKLRSDCRQVWQRCLKESTILITPFCLLEVLSGENATKEFPRAENIVHASFTQGVAEAMASWARPAAKKRVQKEQKTLRKVVEYDALTVGIAAYHGATLVSLAPSIFDLAKLAKVKAVTPNELLKWTQLELVAADETP